MRFYWYDHYVVSIYLAHKFKTPNFYQLLGATRYKKLHDINRMFSNRPYGMIHDITGHIPNPMNVETNIAYNFVSTCDTFDKVAVATATKIANSTTRRIAVTWSGGIDSTSALVALMQVVPWSRLIVVCNESSINEFPEFYYRVIQKNIETITHAEWFERTLDFFSVSGDAGDTVWGAIAHGTWNDQNKNFNKPWQDFLSQTQVDADFIEEFCSWSGTKIKTFLELRVWFYLCCKWQDKAMKFYYDNPHHTLDSGVPFYNVDNLFRNWAMNNLDLIIGQRWCDYKIPAKQFINNFFNDKDYLFNKTKVESMSMHWATHAQAFKHNSGCIALDTNYQNHTLPSWPLIDSVQFEDWNDQYQLTPTKLL